MRKEYIAPITCIVKVQYQHNLLVNSLELSGVEAEVNEQTNDYNTLSRQGSSFWDDDED